MKYKKILQILTVTLFTIFTFLLLFTLLRTNNHFMVTNLTKIMDELPDNMEDLLKKDYGKSKFYTKKGDTSIDLERIVNEKYFIVYSWMSGDKSSLCAVFVVSDKKENPINSYKVTNIKCSDNLGKNHYALSYYFENYPTDKPLKYKKYLYLRFLPFDEDVKSISLKFDYLGNTYIFTNIPIR